MIDARRLHRFLVQGRRNDCAQTFRKSVIDRPFNVLIGSCSGRCTHLPELKVDWQLACTDNIHRAGYERGLSGMDDGSHNKTPTNDARCTFKNSAITDHDCSGAQMALVKK